MRVRSSQRLRLARKAAGLDQHQLAYLCGRTQQAISLLERGLLVNIGEEFAFDIAKYTRKPVEYLFEAREGFVAPEGANDSQVKHGAAAAS